MRRKRYVWRGSLGRKMYFHERMAVFMTCLLTAIIVYGAIIVWREPSTLPYWIVPALASPSAWLAFFTRKEERQNIQKSNERIATFNKKNETDVPYHRTENTYDNDSYNDIGGGTYG